MHPFGGSEANARAAVRPSPIFLAVLGLTAAAGVFCYQADVNDLHTHTTTTSLLAFLFIVGGWIVSVCLHEFAHAYLAWRFGDREMAARGYLTLNPLKYSHPLLSIALPVIFIAIGGFGLPGGAVYIDQRRLQTKAQRSAMSAAGPLVNLALAIILIGAAKLASPYSSHPLFWVLLGFLGFLQLTAAVLNLLPIPGLDGYGVIEPYLDPTFTQGAEQFKPFGMLALFVFLQFNSVNRTFFNMVDWLFERSGLSADVARVGFQLIKFWQN